MNEVGAVVVSFNSERTLARCVRSLWAAGVKDVVIVDNNSGDTSVAVAQGLGVPVVSSSTNQGFAVGCNQGAALLPYHDLLFLNPDAWIDSSALTRAHHRLRDQNVGIVGLRLVSPEGQEELTSRGPEVTLVGLWQRRRAREADEIGWVSGGAMLVRGEVFQQLEGFDGDYFLYWEDVDLCKRARAEGYEVVFEPRADVWHERGASLAHLGQKTTYYDESADRYFRKHYATPIWLTQRFLRRIHRLFTPQVR